MKVGYGYRDITPSTMMIMAGYDLRTEKATGVHDPLGVRAVLIQEGDTQAALLVYDLLGVPMYLKDRIHKALTLGFLTLEVAAIHTHAAPKTHFRSFTCFDPAYEDRLIQAGVEALQEAAEDLTEATLTHESFCAENVASFRDETRENSHFAMPVDVLLFRQKDKAPLRILVIRTHPTVLNESNFLMSRDLVYGIDQALRQKDPKAINLFLNGACADISTRYTRKEATFEEVDRLGQIFANGMETSNEAEEAGGALEANQMTLTIPPATFFTDRERAEILTYLKEKIETCQDPAQRREYIACQSVLRRPLYGKNPDGSEKTGNTVEISTIHLGGVDLIFLPFEYAFKDERLLKQAAEEMTVRKAIIVCYANGYEGYLPSGKPLTKDSGYEDMASSYRSDAKELVKAAVLSLIRK